MVKDYTIRQIRTNNLYTAVYSLMRKYASSGSSAENMTATVNDIEQ